MCNAHLTAYSTQKEKRDGITTYSRIQTGSCACNTDERIKLQAGCHLPRCAWWLGDHRWLADPLGCFGVSRILRAFRPDLPQQFADQNEMANFMKNIAIAGGFLFLFANGAGAWSLDNRSQLISLPLLNAQYVIISVC